ncbi:Putative SOS response-associated peptidase YedK [Alteromonadaceae bacterium Bs31]|nr:Putative SOS response-associated peptidase YedK [Alteromonadaceae bacterium Bs31]
MCGRFANHVRDMHRWMDILKGWPGDVPTGFNIAPTQIAPVYASGRTYGMRWGLIPSWSKEPSSKYATFNARVEGIDKKPAFRQAWNKKQNCLVPALGYYEWKKVADGKQPFFIRNESSDDLLLMAGLWEQRGDDLSFTVLTEAAQGAMAELHHRIPVLLNQDQADKWLQGTLDLNESGSNTQVSLIYYAVGRDVNNVRNQGEQLIGPLDEES